MTANSRTKPQPAHRPSRRDDIIDAGMLLFARVSFDEVTVGDIADASEMTPAAVYYHFAGKEQILLEGTRAFTSELLLEAQRGVDARMQVAELITLLLEHVRKRRTSASVYFINSAGLNLALEAHRKLVRAELSETFSDAARICREGLSAAEAGVMGAALVSLLEVSAVSVLAKDAVFKSFGARQFPAVVEDLANRIIGLD
jgi:AcrR family transcriptional regulator